MKTRILLTVGLAMTLLLCLSWTYTGATAQPPSIGQRLVGTWEVTLRLPACTFACQCPPAIGPDTLTPALQTYSGDGTMEEVYSGSLLLFRSDALGSWERVGGQEYSARYKFFIIDPTTGERLFMDVVTSHIELQGQDAFEATATFNRFAADGVTPVQSGCPIEITGRRF